jgi:predicted xylose isomerase-like sugar epimerase
MDPGAILTVKGIPDKLYNQLKMRAKRNNPGLSSETINSLQMYANRSAVIWEKILDLARMAQRIGQAMLEVAEVYQAKWKGRATANCCLLPTKFYNIS